MKTPKFSTTIFVTGALVSCWLCTGNAHATILAAANDTTPDLAGLIQKWGVLLALIGTLMFPLAIKAITSVWAIRREWQKQVDDWEAERQKRREITATQEIHDVQIKQLNAASPNPVPTIAPPTNSQPLKP